MTAMGLQGPIRFSAVRRINSIESIELNDAEMSSPTNEVEKSGSNRNLIEGGRP
jgi:hypothetical protein